MKASVLVLYGFLSTSLNVWLVCPDEVFLYLFRARGSDLRNLDFFFFISYGLEHDNESSRNVSYSDELLFDYISKFESTTG